MPGRVKQMRFVPICEDATGGEGRNCKCEYCFSHFLSTHSRPSPMASIANAFFGSRTNSCMPDATYLQRVPRWGITSSGEVTIHAGNASFPLQAGEDYRVASTQPKPEIAIADSPIVFVGYGIVAPEYRWDDYKKGSAVISL